MAEKKIDLMVVVALDMTWFDVACDEEVAEQIGQIKGVFDVGNPNKANYRRVTTDPRYSILELLVDLAMLVANPGIQCWQTETKKDGYSESFALQERLKSMYAERAKGMATNRPSPTAYEGT